jgi:hypothetical protein
LDWEHSPGGIQRERSSRPVIFLDGRGWRREAPRGGTALAYLFHRAPRVPTAAIQLDTIDHHLHLKVGCFGFGPAGVITRPTFSESGEVSLLEHAAGVARRDADRWRTILSKLPAGANIDLTRIGADFANLALFDLEVQTGEKLDEYYRTTPAHIREGARVVGPALQLVAAGLADFFHLTRHGASPCLPMLLPSIAAGFPTETVQALSQDIIKHYETMYCLQAQDAGRRGADLLLDLAAGLAAMEDRLRDRSAVTRVLKSAVSTFLADRGCPAETSLVTYARERATSADAPFLAKVARIWQQSSTSLPSEVEDAKVLAGKIEQRHLLTSAYVCCVHLGALGFVASSTGQPQILFVG